MAKEDQKAETKNKIVDDIEVDEVVIEDEDLEEVENDTDEGEDADDPTDDPEAGSDNDDFKVDLEAGSLPDDLADQEGDTSTIRAMRKKLREARSREAELKTKLEKNNVEKDLPTLGAKPTLEDADYDEEAYDKALLEYNDRKRQHDAKKTEVENYNRQARESYQERFSSYQTEKARLNVPDFDEGEKLVRSKLSDMQAGIIIDAANNPALLMLALSQNPKPLQALADEKNPSRFAAQMAVLEVKMKSSLAKKASPERRISGGNVERGTVGDKKLNQLRAKAEKTGDYTAVSAYKRKLKATKSK